MEGWVDLGDRLHIEMIYSQTVTQLRTNPAVHGRDSNLQPVDHQSDALTTTPCIGFLVWLQDQDQDFEIENCQGVETSPSRRGSW